MLVSLLIIMGIAISDKNKLQDSLIRFHVVANSDREDDQNVKLLVRDAVLESIQTDLSNVADVKQARAYLMDNLPKIESLANTVLESAGFDERAVVTLCKEVFDIREYDTFTLPSGVYEALRIVIGEGEGHNWWCVTFPSLCLPATSGEFVETAAQAGLSEHLTQSLVGEKEYEIHFFLMDMIGKIENSFLRS